MLPRSGHREKVKDNVSSMYYCNDTKNLSLSFRSKKLIDDTQSHLKDIKEILKVFSYYMFEDQYILGFVIYLVNLVRERA